MRILSLQFSKSIVGAVVRSQSSAAPAYPLEAVENKHIEVCFSDGRENVVDTNGLRDVCVARRRPGDELPDFEDTRR